MTLIVCAGCGALPDELRLWAGQWWCAECLASRSMASTARPSITETQGGASRPHQPKHHA